MKNITEERIKMAKLKVYVKNKGWTRVDQLTENDEILTE